VGESRPRAAQEYQRRVFALKANIEERGRSLARQLAEASKPRDPGLSKPFPLTGWSKRVQEGRLEFDGGQEPATHLNLLHIAASHGKAAGSWRTRLQLDPGRYRFEGPIRVRDVEPANPGAGAGLRISGARPRREFSGSAEWRPFVYEFQVESQGEVEFICELRALAGEAWFDADKLQVVRVD